MSTEDPATPAPADRNPAGSVPADRNPAGSVPAAGSPPAAGSAGSASGAGPAGPKSGEGVPGTGSEAEDPAARKRGHAVRGILAAALILEGITVLFVPQTIAGISDEGLGGRRLAVLLVLAAALFVAAGIQKRPAGLLLGSLLQVAVILTGLMVGAMYFLGLLFAAVWGFLLWVRQEIARAADRAAGQAGSPPV